MKHEPLSHRRRRRPAVVSRDGVVVRRGGIIVGRGGVDDRGVRQCGHSSTSAANGNGPMAQGLDGGRPTPMGGAGRKAGFCTCRRRSGLCCCGGGSAAPMRGRRASTACLRRVRGHRLSVTGPSGSSASGSRVSGNGLSGPIAWAARLLEEVVRQQRRQQIERVGLRRPSLGIRTTQQLGNGVKFPLIPLGHPRVTVADGVGPTDRGPVRTFAHRPSLGVLYRAVPCERSHSCASAHARAHTQACMHTHTHMTLKHRHTHALAGTKADTHTRTHSYTHTRRHKRTRTHNACQHACGRHTHTLALAHAHTKPALTHADGDRCTLWPGAHRRRAPAARRSRCPRRSRGERA
jgi:hypothetical protein